MGTVKEIRAHANGNKSPIFDLQWHSFSSLFSSSPIIYLLLSLVARRGSKSSHGKLSCCIGFVRSCDWRSGPYLFKYICQLKHFLESNPVPRILSVGWQSEFALPYLPPSLPPPGPVLGLIIYTAAYAVALAMGKVFGINNFVLIPSVFPAEDLCPMAMCCTVANGNQRRTDE